MIGSYGEVYICVQKDTEIARAVKVILKDSLPEEDKERFFSEINILKILDHPNIVRLFEVFQDSKRFYLVTE